MTKKIQGSWYTINIKAYNNQVKEHYLQAIDLLSQEDPLVRLRGNRHISIEGIDYVGDRKNPKIIMLRLCAYDVMDPDAFYDLRKKEQVLLDLNPDIVSNKKSGTLYFVPDVHRFMILKSSEVPYRQIIKYFEGEFRVDVEVSHEVIETIEKSYMIDSLEAKLSYSNHDSYSDFVSLFDGKANEAGSESITIKLKSGINKGLRVVKDGLVQAILHIVKSNGSASAKIRKNEGDPFITVKTDDYPEVVRLEGHQDDIPNAVRNHLIKQYGREK